MATLRVISEEGIPHVACRMTWDDGRVRWVGWQPVKGLPYWSVEDHGRGWIEEEDKEAAGKVNYYVTFRVTDADLDRAEHSMVRDYVVNDDTYGFGLRDCVTFARDVADYCGLSVQSLVGFLMSPGRGPVDFLPYELLLKLRLLNSDRVIEEETDLL